MNKFIMPCGAEINHNINSHNDLLNFLDMKNIITKKQILGFYNFFANLSIIGKVNKMEALLKYLEMLNLPKMTFDEIEAKQNKIFQISIKDYIKIQAKFKNKQNKDIVDKFIKYAEYAKTVQIDFAKLAQKLYPRKDYKFNKINKLKVKSRSQYFRFKLRNRFIERNKNIFIIITQKRYDYVKRKMDIFI